MKKYLIFLLLYIPQIIFAQEYVNKIIPFPFGNPNFKNIEYFNGKYVIPVVYPSDSSTLIVTDLNTETYYHYVDFVFSLSAMTIVDNEMYLYAKDRNFSNDLQFARLNNDFTYNWKKEIHTAGDFNFPLSSISLGRNVFATYIFETGNIRKFGIFNIKPDGTIKWNKVYDNNLKYATLWDLDSRNGNYILGSYNVTYTNDFNSSVRVIKIDTSGQEIWKSDTLRGVNDNDDAVWMTELSDSNIFLTYKVNKFFDPEFFDLHPYPPTFIWLDKNGKKIKELVLKMKRDFDLYISELKSGKGDYFYAFGRIRTFGEDDYGLITKYANNGDTIWSHTYRHPNFNNADYIYNINDLIEEDNGDLTVLGAITPLGEKPEVWVFRVNSDGCFGTDSCDQFTLGDHDVIKPDAIEISCYPNPTKGIVTLTSLPVSGTYAIQIYSIGGWLMDSYKERNPSNIDLGHLESGVYVIQISDKKISYTLKAVKQ